jgi:hypothetical protein
MVAGDSSSPDARTDRLAVGDVAFDQRLQQRQGALVHGDFHCTDRAASSRVEENAVV